MYGVNRTIDLSRGVVELLGTELRDFTKIMRRKSQTVKIQRSKPIIFRGSNVALHVSNSILRAHGLDGDTWYFIFPNQWQQDHILYKSKNKKGTTPFSKAIVPIAIFKIINTQIKNFPIPLGGVVIQSRTNDIRALRKTQDLRKVLGDDLLEAVEGKRVSDTASKCYFFSPNHGRRLHDMLRQPLPLMIRIRHMIEVIDDYQSRYMKKGVVHRDIKSNNVLCKPGKT